MVLGERALALEARRDRGGELLGEAPEGRPRPRVVHPLPGVDERALGLDEEGGDALHVRGVRTRAGAHDRLVVERLRDVLGEHVARHLDDRRARAAVSELGERPAEDVRDLRRARHRLARLGDRAKGGGRVEVRPHVGDRPRVAHRHDQDRHRLAERLRDPSERVLRPRPVLHREHPDAIARAQARHRVRHVKPDSLLADDDGAEVRPRRVLDDVVDRVPDERVHPLALEDLGDRISRLHACISCLVRLFPPAWGMRRLRSRSCSRSRTRCRLESALAPAAAFRSGRGRRSDRTSREGSPAPEPALPRRRSRTARPRSIARRPRRPSARSRAPPIPRGCVRSFRR